MCALSVRLARAPVLLPASHFRAMDDSDDERYVQLRPYGDAPSSSSRRPGPPPTKSAKPAGPKAAPPGPKRFVPRPPSERANVDEVLFQSTARSSSDPLAMLAAAQKLNPSHGGDRPQVHRQQGTSLAALGIKGGAGNKSKKSGGGSMFHSGVDADAGRRNVEEGREGKSKRLTDLAYQEEKIVNGRRKKYYNPISLPFYHTGEGDSDEEEKDKGNSNKKESRPKMEILDEANKGAARRLFVDEDGDGGLRENQFFLMQIPAVLPELVNTDEEVQREGEDAATAGAGAAITRFPDGLVGKLKIHKSGKVRMDFGGIPFCVDQGCTTFFRQELALVDNKNTCFSLDEVVHRVVLTPDIDAMFPADAGAGDSNYAGAGKIDVPDIAALGAAADIAALGAAAAPTTAGS